LGGLFYVSFAKACYVVIGSKRIACGVAVLACAAATRGANKL